ncbi:hypothetical protein C3L33_17288, partial [Rhododendron williamsianum]
MVDAVVSFVVERLGWRPPSAQVDIRDVRDVAYDAEDIIDNFILKVEEGHGTPKKMELKDCFQKYFCICSKHDSLIEQANLYGIGIEINTLKKRLDEIQRNREYFNIRDISGREGSDLRNERQNQIRREMPYKDNELVVGFREDAAKLMSELVKEVKHRSVISIVGMGGLDYNIHDLQKIIKSFKRPTSKEEFEFLEKMKEDDLEFHLRNYLEGRRYLVVVDDVWDVNAWASLRRDLPDNKNGSRVIVMPRSKTVAKHCNERPYVHELPFLKEEESWKLFCKKVFPTYDEVGDKKFFRPPRLEGLAREMLGHDTENTAVKTLRALGFERTSCFGF